MWDSFERRPAPGVAAPPPYHGAVTGERYRCTACGNLTRFDVVASRRTRSFHHYDLAGDLALEEVEVLSEVVESVTCRWCGPSGSVEAVAAIAVEEDAR